jgi:hypothetical protein
VKRKKEAFLKVEIFFLRREEKKLTFLPPPFPEARLSGALFPSVETCKLFPHATLQIYFLVFAPPLPAGTGEFQYHSATASACTQQPARE